MSSQILYVFTPMLHNVIIVIQFLKIAMNLRTEDARSLMFINQFEAISSSQFQVLLMWMPNLILTTQ